MKILALGNSFSEDCTAHLGRMTDAYVRNLYIGSCSLERHARNLTEQIPDYAFQENAVMIGEKHVTANEIIASQAWDVITLQQVSQLSGIYDSFEPYLSTVVSHIRTLCPTARLVWNQTWVYATYTTHTGYANYGSDQANMQRMIEAASHRVAEENGFGLIEVGKAITHLRAVLPPDGTELCRDGFHLSLDYGRYAASCVWAKYFSLPVNADYLPEGADPARIALIREALGV